MKKSKLLVVLGPTASGKSLLATELAGTFNGELISADSRQVYRGMDIGTAKTKSSTNVPMRLVDIVNPDESFTLRDYQNAAFEAIGKALAGGRLPILAGGTAMYIDAVVDNWDIPQVPPQKGLRESLETRLAHEGLEALVRELEAVDPDTARLIDRQNPRRVIRALEVAITSGSSFIAQQKRGGSKFDTLKIGLSVSREELARRLQKRTREMIKTGLIEETKTLIKKYPDAIALISGIGYREVLEYLAGSIDQEKMEALIVQRSLQYARRQMTWWKRDQTIHWISAVSEARSLVSSWK